MVMSNSSKKIVVTGADGFIGSHLCEALVKKGYEVKALCMYNSFSHAGWLEDSEFKTQLEICFFDVRDFSRVEELFSGTDIVFHLASLIGIPYSYLAAESYIQTNVLGTLNVCKSVIKNDISHLIQTSTSEVYGSALYVPIDEKHPFQAQSPYSASKISADAIAYSFYSSSDLPLTIARPFNTFGPRQSLRAVIPTIISQLANKEIKKLNLGNLTTKRDFNFVDNTVEGLISILDLNPAGETFNIGSGHAITIRSLYELISKTMNISKEIESNPDRMRPVNSEVHELQADIHKLTSHTGFLPKIDLESGLLKTISWYTNKENLLNHSSKYAI